MFSSLEPGERQAAAGFEPAYNGFANRRLRPLGYAANRNIKISLKHFFISAMKFEAI
jgi:hypothetical protein